MVAYGRASSPARLERRVDLSNAEVIADGIPDSTAAALVMVTAATGIAQSPRRVTIDDLMALRTINDVKISPAGDRIAYTVSTPSLGAQRS